MDLNKNYYGILGVSNTSTEKEIKKSYYKLSFVNHPDKGGDQVIFTKMTEAYDILCGLDRKTYDLKSKFGNNYNEYFEFFEINTDVDYNTEKERLEKFKKYEINDIYINIGDDFKGFVEFERWVKCKTCDGSGKDFSSKIVIRDNDGNILRMFDSDDGCDFCEGSGEYMGKSCSFCNGMGKVGLTSCSTCSGEKRILGKQKLKNIKLEGNETKIPSMGNYSKDGRIGSLVLKCVK